MQERTKYQQLQLEDPMSIASMTQQGSSMRAMVHMLGRLASSISREVGRNAASPALHASYTTQLHCAEHRQAGRAACKLDTHSVSWGVVRKLPEREWSPQQIAATLKRVFPHEPEQHVSLATSYTAIDAQPRGELRRHLIACLRHGRSTRMPRSRSADRRGRIPVMVSIHERPPEVNDRVMPGHWERDFIRGAGNKFSVGVLVEPTSPLVPLAKMDDATATSVLAGFSAKLNSIAAPTRRSLTYDQGKKLTRYEKKLTERTGVAVYLWDPHSPWQRDTCVNTNGVLRQYLPKGTDLSVFTQDELDEIADSLNGRPRATHGFNTPLAVFTDILATAHPAPLSPLTRC